MRRSALVATLLMALSVPTMASAQIGGPGFLFQRPKVSIGIRGGYQVPRAGGDLFNQTLDEFIPSGADTLSSLSFDAPYLGGEIAFRPWERWDLAFGMGWTRSRTVSEYRRWVDNLSNPIEQETTYQLITGTLGGKYYFQDRDAASAASRGCRTGWRRTSARGSASPPTSSVRWATSSTRARSKS